MPGFAADIRLSPKQYDYAPSEARARMLSTLAPGEASSAEGADWSIASRSHDSHNGTFEANGIAIAIDGEIAVPESVRSAIPIETRPDPSATVPEIIHAYYRAWGPEALTKLNGIYAIVVYDDNEKRAHVITDRTGYRWVYYWASAGRIVVSTQARAIGALPDFPTEADPDAVYEMMSYGYCLDDRTLFKHIRILDSGMLLTATADTCHQERHCDIPADGATEETAPLDEYIEEFARLYKQAVERQFHDRLCVQPTGGFDSRSIAAMVSLCRDGETVLANTMGPEDSIDVMSGGRIARDLGIAHTVIPNPNDYLARLGRESVWLNDGSSLMQTCWRMGQRDWLEQNDLRHITHGHLGFILKGASSFAKFIENPDVEMTFKKLLSISGGVTDDPDLEALFGRERADSLRAQSVDHFRSIFDNAKTESLYRKREFTTTVTRERRYIAVYRTYFQQHCRVHIPIADHELHDFLIDMPLSARLYARSLIGVLKRYAPRATRAPLTTTGIPPGAGPLTTARYRAWGRFYYKVLPRLTGGAVGTRNRNLYIEYAGALRDGSRSFVEETMARADGISDLIDVGHARKMVNDMLEDRAPGYGYVYSLMTLVHWHELFREKQGYSEFIDS